MTLPPESADFPNDFVANPLVLRCVEVIELVTHYLDDALELRDREAMQQHLAGCDGCTVFVAQIQVTVQLTAAVGQREAKKLPSTMADLSMLVAQRNEPTAER